MSKSKVYHRDPLLPNPFDNQEQTGINFKLIAEVDSLDLDDIFKLTNHIDHDWTENSEVSLIVNKPLRSTSIGDVVVIEDKHFLVELFGWKEVSKSILG
jgi:hypothetical protein